MTLSKAGPSDSLHQWPVAILAGGLAKRLRPITETIPKALVSVAGEPFLRHQLRLLRSKGLHRFVLCVGYLGEMIEANFGDGAKDGVEIQYSYDGPHLLGTGGALRMAIPLLGEKFFVLYGDSYLPIDYCAIAETFERTGAPALMTVFENRNRWDNSNVVFEEGMVQMYDKNIHTPEMRYIDYGLSILRASLLLGWPPSATFDVADLYHALARDGKLAGYEVKERFYEIGSHAGLADLEKLLHATPHPELTSRI